MTVAEGLRVCRIEPRHADIAYLVEEPFDQVPCAIQIRAEADRVFAISLRWMFGPCALLADKLPDPVRAVAAIREQHRLGEQRAEEN